MSAENGTPLKRIIDKKYLKKLFFDSPMQSMVPVTSMELHVSGKAIFKHKGESDPEWNTMAVEVLKTPVTVKYAPELEINEQEVLGFLLQNSIERFNRTYKLGLETLETYKEINTVFEVSQALSSSRFIKDIVVDILNEFQKILPTAYSSIWISPKDGKKIQRHHHILTQKTVPLLVKDEQKLVEYLMNEYGRADIFTPPYPEFFPEFRTDECCCIFVPLQTAKRNLGGIFLFGSPRKVKNSDTAVFRSVDLKMAKSIGQQAAYFIQNTLLLEDIEQLFNSMVKSMVRAIDERDPATSGHSARVSVIAQKFAKAVSDTTEGKFKDVQYSKEDLREIQYAGLLHDIGKIGVREEILKKHHKLGKGAFDALMSRFDFISLKYGIDLKKEKECVTRVNSCYMLSDEDLETIENLNGKIYEDLEGNEKGYLTPEEYDQLSIRRGNLTMKEVEEMKRHPGGTKKILSKIPFSKDLARVPTIAAQHHEKINGVT